MVYAAWIIDYFYDSRELIGVFSTEGAAEAAINIAIGQARKKDPDNTPEGRYDWCWEEIPLDGFNEEALYIFT